MKFEFRLRNQCFSIDPSDIPDDSGSFGGDPIPPTPGPTQSAADTGLITATGGLVGYETLLLIPIYDPEFKHYGIGTFDFEDFNCEEDATYYFRQEIVLSGRQITVTNVRIIYRDLGVCKVTATVSTAQGSISKQLTIGSAAATGNLITAKFDFVITGERPQIQIFRAANDGPLSITEAAMITDVEIAEYI